MAYYAHHHPSMHPAHAQPWAGPGARSTSPSSMQVYIPVTIPLAFDEHGAVIVPTFVEEEPKERERRPGSRQKKKNGKGNDRERKKSKNGSKSRSVRSSLDIQPDIEMKRTESQDSRPRSSTPTRRPSRRRRTESPPPTPPKPRGVYDKEHRDANRHRERDSDRRNSRRFILQWVRTIIPGIPPPSYASPPVSPIASPGSYFGYHSPPQQYAPYTPPPHQTAQYQTMHHQPQHQYQAQAAQYPRPMYRRHSSLEWAMRKLTTRDRSPGRHPPASSPSPRSPSRTQNTRTPQPPPPHPMPETQTQTQTQTRPRPTRLNSHERQDGATKIFDTVATACAECARRAVDVSARAGRALAPIKKVRFADGGVPGAHGYAWG